MSWGICRQGSKARDVVANTGGAERWVQTNGIDGMPAVSVSEGRQEGGQEGRSEGRMAHGSWLMTCSPVV